MPSFIGILDCPQQAYLISQVPPHTVAAAMEDQVVQKIAKHSREDLKTETNLEMKLSGTMGTKMALARMDMKKPGPKEVLAVKIKRTTRRRDRQTMAGKCSCILFFLMIFKVNYLVCLLSSDFG